MAGDIPANPPKTADVAKVEQRDLDLANKIIDAIREQLSGHGDRAPVICEMLAAHRHQALSPARGEGDLREAASAIFVAVDEWRQTPSPCPTVEQAVLDANARLRAALSEQPRPSAPEVSGDRERGDLIERLKSIARFFDQGRSRSPRSAHTIRRAILALSPAASVSAEGAERLREVLIRAQQLVPVSCIRWHKDTRAALSLDGETA